MEEHKLCTTLCEMTLAKTRLNENLNLISGPLEQLLEINPSQLLLVVVLIVGTVQAVFRLVEQLFSYHYGH